MRDRTCAYCGELVKGRWIELSVSDIAEKKSGMKKVDLHPKCFEEIWGKCEFIREGNEADAMVQELRDGQVKSKSSQSR